MKRLLVLVLFASVAHAAPPFNMVTASERGTYFRFCNDMATFVAKPAGIDLGCVPTAGSIENVKLLRYAPGDKLAIVQSDVFRSFLDLATTNHEAANIIRPLRVVMPLYDEEIYLIVRADSPLQWIHEIKGQKMSIGPAGSGTTLSMAALYSLMFGEQIPDTVQHLANEDALVRLLTDKTVDVVAVTGGQPMTLLTGIKPEAKKSLRFLKLDPENPASKAALATYFPATVRRISYPNLLDDDFQSLAVKALLVTYDFGYKNQRQRPSAETLVKFVRSLCANIGVLQDQGHSKWRDVEIAMPALGKDWSYYEPTARALDTCIGANKPTVPPAKSAEPASCSSQAKILGLC